MEPVEGAAFDVMDFRLHRALHDDGGGAWLRPGIRPCAMAWQGRLRRRDALSRARGRSDHRQRRPCIADEIDRADQHRPRPILVAPAAPGEVRRRTGPHQWRRWGINVVTGYKPSEYRMFGLEPIEHDLRYVMADEFTTIMERLWTEDEELTFDGTVLEDGACLPGAKARTAAPVPGQRRVVRRRPRLRGEAFRPDLHHQSRWRRSGRGLRSAARAQRKDQGPRPQIRTRGEDDHQPSRDLPSHGAGGAGGLPAILENEDTVAADNFVRTFQSGDTASWRGHTRAQWVIGGNVHLVGTPEQIVEWFGRLARGRL